MRFTDNELSMISNGLITLINDVSETKKHVTRKETLEAIDQELNMLVNLNDKVCRMMNVLIG